MYTALLCLGLILCFLSIQDPVTGQCSGVNQARAPISLKNNGYNLLIGVDASIAADKYPDLLDRIKVSENYFLGVMRHEDKNKVECVPCRAGNL